MANLAGKLLFGNISKDGSLDSSEFDKETSKSIADVPANLLGLNNSFLNDVVDKDDLLAAKADNTDYSQKAVGAIDFSDFDEDFEDIDPIQEKSVPVEDDLEAELFAEMEEEQPELQDTSDKGKQKDATPTSDMEIDEIIDEEEPKKPESSKAAKLLELFEDIEFIKECQLPITINDEIEYMENRYALKRLCSSFQNEAGEPILKFSELFAPDSPLAPKKKTKNNFKYNRILSDYQPDTNEEEIFDQQIEGDKVGFKKRKIDKISEKYPSNIGHPLIEQGQIPVLSHTPIALDSSSNFYFVDWEDDIIWDEEDTENIEPQINEPISSELLKSFALIRETDGHRLPVDYDNYEPAPKRRKIFGAFDEDFIPQNNNNFNKKQNSNKSYDLEWSKFQAKNPSIEDGSWVDAIIWEEEQAEFMPKNKLILDLNDKLMFFEETSLESESDIIVNNSTTNQQQEEQKKRGRKPKIVGNESNQEFVKPKDENLDKFNISNDTFYKQRTTRVQKRGTRTSVQHAPPAIKLSLVRTDWDDESLRLFHRPRGKEDCGTNKIVASKERNTRKNKQQVNRVDSMKHKKDLSAKDGRVVILEYMEQNPPLIGNIGMGSKIRNYYKKIDADDQQGSNLDLEDGETFILDENDESPFLGEINPGTTIQAIDNNMYRAPIFEHKVPETDFMLVRSKKTGKFYIREIPSIYTAGQTLPLMEVNAPNSRLGNNFVKNRLQAFIFRLLRKNNGRIRISEVTTAFPVQSEASIRKRLKECANFQRGGDSSGWWILKDDYILPTEDELKTMVSPEAVCGYESMLAGQVRLEDSGVKKYTNPYALEQIYDSLGDSIDEETKNKTKIIEDELSRTPWNMTTNMINHMRGKGKFHLLGIGEGDSVTLKKAGKRGDNPINIPMNFMPSAGVPKKTVTGTDADLRKVSLTQATKLLQEFGVPDDEIAKLSRWDRIRFLRQKASEAAVAGEGGSETNKFARGKFLAMDNFSSTKINHTKEAEQEIFDSMLKSLGDPDPDISDDEEIEAFEDLEKDLEDMFEDDIVKPAPISNQLQKEKNELAEEEEYRRFLQQNKNYNEVVSKNNQRPVEQFKTVTDEAILNPFGIDNNNNNHNIDNNIPVDPNAPSDINAILENLPDSSNESHLIGEPISNSNSPLNSNSNDSFPFPFPFPKQASFVVNQNIQPNAEPNTQQNIIQPNAAQKPVQNIQNNGKPVPKAIRKITTVKNADGTTTQQVDLITDPAIIAMMIRKREEEQKQRKGKPVLTTEEENQKKTLNKKAQALKNQLKVLEKSGQPRRKPGPKPKSEATSKCTACGAIGHKRSNRNCPKHAEWHSSDSESESEDDFDMLPEKVGTEIGEDGSVKIKYVPGAKGLNGLHVLEQYESATGRSSKKRRNGDVEFSNLLEKIITELKQMPFSNSFLRPVPRNEAIAPNYYNIVENPIDLSAILEKVRTFQYKSTTKFLEDIELLYTNCVLYNSTRFAHLIPLAEDLRDFAKSKVNSMNDDLSKLEKEIEDEAVDKPIMAKQKRKKKPIEFESKAVSLAGGMKLKMTSSKKILQDQKEVAPVFQPIKIENTRGSVITEGWYDFSDEDWQTLLDYYAGV